MTTILVAANASELTWYKLDFPPYTIRQGVHQDKGLGDKIQRFVADKLDDYQHSTYYVTASRLYNDLNSGKQVCTVNSNYDIADANRRAISIPTNIYYNYNLVGRLDSDSSPKNTLSLLKILRETPDKLLLDAGRPYQHLDALLTEYTSKAKVQLRTGESLSGAILHMIDKKRADYTLELCSTVRYLSSTEPFEHQFFCAQILENNDVFGRAAITCSKNDWGDKTIEKINTILTRYRGRPEYMQMMQQWYVPDNPEQQKQYWQAYQQKLLSVIQ